MQVNVPLTIDEIHEGTLIILKKIIEICDKININYFVAYGSLIGAVRHKGFIPWDDDFDIIMLRPEYDKFVDYCNLHEQELYPFKLMNRQNTPGYPFNISRFNDLRYRMESYGYPDAGMGMFIDVYPFDGCGNSREDAVRKLNSKKNLLMKLIGLSYEKNLTKSTKGIVNTFGKILLFPFVKLLGTKFFLDKFENIRNDYSFEHSSIVAVLVWDIGLKPIEKWHFEEYELLTFEGVQVKVPKDYDAVLKNSYGDYMKLPPVEKRVATHEYKLYRKQVV